MSETLLYRSSILNPLCDPWLNPQDHTQFWLDGALAVDSKGIILEVGDFHEVLANHPQAAVKDYRSLLLTPGLIDCHLHFPQTQVLGRYGNQLLEWLNQYVFPQEEKLASPEFAQETARNFLRLLFQNGTTSCLSFSTTSPHSTTALFEEAIAHEMRLITGLTGIDRQGTAPDSYRDTPQSFYENSLKLLEQYHNHHRCGYAITPRFALGSTHEQLTKAGELASNYQDCWINTHISENPDEIRTVLEFFPKAKDYLEVYETYGLVREKFCAGHGIYLSESEFLRFSQKGAAIGFCPSSNFFLGSGTFDIARSKRQDSLVRVGVGSDIGAGNSFSLLTTLGDAYKAGMLQFVSQPEHPDREHYKISGLRGLYLVTLGAAQSLYLEDEIGSFQPGKVADFILLNPQATDTLKLQPNCQPPQTLQEADDLFFTLMACGDDRNVEKTYIKGKLVYQKDQESL